MRYVLTRECPGCGYLDRLVTRDHATIEYWAAPRSRWCHKCWWTRIGNPFIQAGTS